MRAIFQRIAALLLAIGALAALLAQAALTHGCSGGPAKQGEPQAPSPPGVGAASDPTPARAPAPAAASAPAPAPGLADEAGYDGYMGATKAPPMPLFRRPPKAPAGGDVEPPVKADDGNTPQQQAP
jgi:hypothetical protein